MKTMFRTLMVLASFALTSALFAGSVNFTLYVGETLGISLWGTTDATLQIIDTDNNQVVADGSFLTYSGGSYTNSYHGSGSGYVSGVSVSIGSYSTITGLPAGNYKVVTSSSNYYNMNQWISGDSIEIDDYENYPGDGSMSYDIEIY